MKTYFPGDNWNVSVPVDPSLIDFLYVALDPSSVSSIHWVIISANLPVSCGNKTVKKYI